MKLDHLADLYPLLGIFGACALVGGVVASHTPGLASLGLVLLAAAGLGFWSSR